MHGFKRGAGAHVEALAERPEQAGDLVDRQFDGHVDVGRSPWLADD